MSGNKMKIGISMRVVNAINYTETRDALSHDWPSFLDSLDIFPVFIPNKLSNTASFLTEMRINGIILSGGDNIGNNSQRDKTEVEIINFAIKSKIPIFGVCRGMQVLNKFFGGDMSYQKKSKHVGKPHTIRITHKIFSDLLKATLKVNSFHNNTIKRERLGKDLHDFAICEDDGTVEGFIHENLPIMGVMWHPERDPNTDNKIILKKFFEDNIITK